MSPEQEAESPHDDDLPPLCRGCGGDGGEDESPFPCDECGGAGRV